MFTMYDDFKSTCIILKGDDNTYEIKNIATCFETTTVEDIFKKTEEAYN